MRRPKVLAALVPCLALSLACGCGAGAGSPLPATPTVPLKGRITYRGKALTKGHVTLAPTDGGREAESDIQPDGTFTVATAGLGDGALVGVHQVVVSGTDQPLRTKGETHVRVVADRTDYAIDIK
ncbi:hypothetical protein OJF2_68950 [Aquisphaera giovannonii]|uniref:Carboxypeptidase regulatory-like domain-containing protein n=1 Tax=Aquisphaera giovannonii TaxID=406548 RepID=A0A5B9WCP9_9BACT|nr:hypothetical protein [Aquisphaera giovannonii]QEH38297.1 hypothetical protein OJF2_68950 [Aquisphaera giovannonii]